MEAPRCKICGHRHYGHQPHNWGKAPADDKPKKTKIPQRKKQAKKKGKKR